MTAYALDDTTADLLSLIANTDSPIGHDAVDAFLAACEADAAAHNGYVSVSRVRARLADADIEHHRYSALWSRFTGRDRPMRKTGEWEACEGSESGNNGKPYPKRVWVGVSA